MKTITLAACVLSALPALAQAQQPNCAPRAVVVDRLTTGFGETRHAIGITNDTQVVEFWGAEESGSWTIVVTLPDGRSCIVAAGVAFEPLAETLPAEGADT